MFTITNPKTHKGLIALFLMVLLFSFEAAAQNEVAIGSTTTKSNAILWLNGNGSQGLILPVVTNKSAVNNPDKGMVVYDDSDNKVWYRNNSAWVEVGSGTGASTANLNLLLQGNQLQLRDGSTVQSTVNIAGGTQTNGAFLVFTGGSWQYATLSGDVTGANGALQVNGIKGKTIATLPTTTQALVYNPAANAGAGGWSFQVLPTVATIPTLNNGQLLTGNGTTNTATTITGDATLSGGAITIGNNAITTAKINANAVDATKLADNAVTTAKISDATITGADIAATTITADKLAQSSATTGQILKWNGTNWVPQNETTGTTTILSNGQILTGNGTTNAATTLSGDATLTGGVLTISNNAITTAKINANAVDATKLADNAVTTAKISDATITGADIAATTITGSNIAATTITADKLAQSAATSGQVLKWNGTNWVPAADDAGVGATPTLSSGQILTGNGTTNSATALTGDATLAGGVITIGNNAITTAKINTAAVDATKLADNSVTTLKVADNAITTSKINAAAVDATKLADGSVTNLKVANDAITSAKITDATITGADIAATTITGTNIANTTITGANIAATTITADKLAQSAATSGQVLKWNGTNWVPAADDAGVGATPTLSSGQILTGNGTTNSATVLSGDATLAGGVITIGNNAITTAKINAAAVDATKLADNSVTTLKVADNAITTAKINAAAVDATKLADGSVTNLKIANDAITSAKITNATITGADIAATTITGSNIAAATIAGSNIANTTITGANIAATTITADKLAQSAATSGQVLKWNGTNWVPAADDAGVGATPTLSSGQILTGDGTTNSATVLSGDATLAGGVITIGNNAITTAKINAAAVDATKLADNSVTTLKVADNAITTTKINAGAVDATKLADNSVTTLKVADNAITNAKINAAAVDATKLADNAVTTLKVADNAITTTKISDGSITNLKVANDAITSANITNATITGADIAATTITGANIAATTITADKLAQSAATSGQVLKWNGTNWVPAADDAGVGATPTLSSGQILIGDGTINSAAALSGDATLAGGVMTIGNNAITSAKITDATITGADIAATTITGANIAATTIDATKIIDGSITNLKVANDAITSANITNATITGADIAATTITGANIAATTIDATKIIDGSITNLKVANDAITSANITNATITGADIAATTITGANIAATTITADKLAQSAATSGQVLKWNGTNWVPAADDAGVGATPTLSSGQILTGDGTTNSATVLTGDATLAGGVITIGNNAINSAKIADATITGSDIAATTITDANINAAANIAATKLANTVVLDTETPNVAGDINGDFSTGLQIKANTITAAEITDASITGADLAANIAITTTGNISGGNISGAGSGLTTLNASNITSGSLALARITPSGTNGDVLTTVAGAPVWQAPVTGATTLDGLTDATVTAASSGQLLVNDGAGQFRNVGMSGDATISNTGALTLANSAGTRTNLGLGALATLATVTTTEITDGTIANIDINAAAAIAGTKITPAFGAQPISTTGTLSSGAATVTGLTVSGTTTTINTVGYTWPAVQGGAGTILTNSGTGSLTWTAAGMTNPLTTNGDIIYGVGATPTRLAAGTGFLKGGAVPSYAAVNLASADVSGILPITNGGTGAITATSALSNLGGLSNTLTNGNIFVGSAGNVATPVAMIGDASIINTGAVTIANGAISGGTGGKILDATITDADISGTAAIAGTKVTPNFGAQNISTTGTLSAGATTVTGLTIGTSVWPTNASGTLTNDGTGSLSWAATSGWSLSGNNVAVSDFIGTTNSEALVFKTNNSERARFTSIGSFGIGTTTPSTEMQIDANTPTLRLRSTQSNTLSQSYVEFGHDDGSGGYVSVGSIGDTGAGDFMHIFSPDRIIFNSNFAFRFSIGTNGELGVGGTLDPGTAGQVLTSGGGGSAPSWTSPTVGSLQNAYTAGNTITGANAVDMTLDNGLVVKGALGAGAIPSTGAGVRMMFYPRKAAFRAGRTFDDGATESTSWDDANVGDDSFATGQNTVASGNRSFATGRKSVAAGDASVAMGIGSSALGNYSLAAGFGPDANGQESVSIGRFTFAQSRGEIVLGYNNLLSGGNASSWIATDPLFQLGNGTDASRSTAFTVLKNGKTAINGITPAVTLEVNGTDAMKLPIGTTAQRPATPVAGHLRYNSTSSNVEFYTGSVWQNASASGTSLITNTGTNNLFAGDLVLAAGTNNAVFGYQAGAASLGTSDFNVFVGTQAAQNKTTGDLNTIVGYQAGRSAGTSAGNTFIGANVGENTTSSTNTFIGQSTGLVNTTGFRNVLIGNFAEVGTFDLTNATAIGFRASVNQNNSLVLGSINGVNGALASTNVGIGTTTPSARLDISGNTLIRGTNTNAAPTVSSGLELMVGRSNFGTLIAGQTSADIALNWGGASGGFRHFIQTRHNSVANSNSNSIDFFVNNSTTAAGSLAPNSTTPNGNVLAMSMTAAGIGIGTAAPNANTKVHISGAGTQYLRVEGTGAGAAGGIELDGAGTVDWRIVPQLGILTFNLGDVNGAMNSMYFMNTGNFSPANATNPNPTLGQSTARWGTIFTTVAVNVSSDRRLKNNIHNLNYGLKEILELRPVSYSLRSDKTRNTYLGLIAQEVQELIPEIVSTGDDAEKTLGMRYAELVPVLIKAIQEQQAIIETLKSENAASNDKTEKLNKEIEAIKARLGMTAKVEK